MFETSELYTEILNSTDPIIVLQGGTSSGKTYTALQVLFSKAVSNENEFITIVGESVPNLKKGAMRDTDRILASSDILCTLVNPMNRSERTIKACSGSVMEYTSYVTSQDAHSGKRDRLFINEAPGISWAIAEQLIDRTSKQIIIDYNPSIPFWAHDKLLKDMMYGNKKVKLIISDHRHNPFLTKEQHDHIEMKAKQDPEWGRVYARGLTGKVEGLVYRNWEWCDAVPVDAKKLGSGLDFGFINDPTAVVDVYLVNGELWLDERLFEKGLVNVPVVGATYIHPNISDKIKEEGMDFKDEFVADSAEQKSIAELKSIGWKITPAKKPAGSVIDGINIVKKYKLNVTRRSVNLGKELISYKWKENRDKDPLNEPMDAWNHCLDAVRYVALEKLKPYPSGNYSVM